MELEKLEKAINLKNKLDFVKKVNTDLNEMCIYIGSQQRIDICMDVHDRLKIAMQGELNIIEQEILNEIDDI